MKLEEMNKSIENILRLKLMSRMLRLPDVRSESGLSRSTIYLRISQGLWTKPVHIGARAVGWPCNEVAALNTARITGNTDQEIRALVVNLEAARQREVTN